MKKKFKFYQLDTEFEMSGNDGMPTFKYDTARGDLENLALSIIHEQKSGEDYTDFLDENGIIEVADLDTYEFPLEGENAKDLEKSINEAINDYGFSYTDVVPGLNLNEGFKKAKRIHTERYYISPSDTEEEEIDFYEVVKNERLTEYYTFAAKRLKEWKDRIPYKNAYITAACGDTYSFDGKRYTCVPCLAVDSADDSALQEAVFVRVFDKSQNVVGDYVTFRWSYFIPYESLYRETHDGISSSWDNSEETLNTVTFDPDAVGRIDEQQ